MKILVALSLAAVASPAQADTTTPFDPKPLLKETIERIKATAYRAGDVDWPKLEARVYAAAADDRDSIDLLDSLQLIVNGLGDSHTFINASAAHSEAFRERYGRNYWETRSPPRKPTSGFMVRKEPSARTLDVAGGQAELIVVPKMMGGGEPARRYAEILFGHVAAAADRSCGYILDLRGNTGGNVWPMIVGLSALIGDGPGTGELYRDGRISTYARLEKGAAIVAEEGEQKGVEILRLSNWRDLPSLASMPIALLIDDAVGSSGEGVALQFKGRASTRFFGERTYGHASSNEGWMLNDDINMVVTTAMLRDRSGAIYPDGITPDVPVPAGEGALSDPDDAVVEAAKKWLSAQETCSN